MQAPDPTRRTAEPLAARSSARRTPCAGGLAAVLIALSCAAATAPDPMRYRLAHSGPGWDTSGDDRVLEDLAPRYPEFFALILDAARYDDPDLRELRDDLEKRPVDRRNYDALNAIAIAYFEINQRGESLRGTGDMGFMSQGFRAAKLAAVPWRAYGEIEDGELRGAILDFFEDAASGEKTGSRRTAGRLTGIVASFAEKETDPARLERIESIVARLRASDPGAAAPPRGER